MNEILVQALIATLRKQGSITLYCGSNAQQVYNAIELAASNLTIDHSLNHPQQVGFYTFFIISK